MISAVNGERTQSLDVVPVRPLSWNLHVLQGERTIAELRLAQLRSRGSFAVNGTTFDIRTAGAFSRTFLCAENGRVVARAERHGVLRPYFDVIAHDRRLRMTSPSMFADRFLVQHGARPLGEIRRRSWRKRGAVVTLPEELFLPLLLFLIGVALLTWRSRRRSAGSAGG